MTTNPWGCHNREIKDGHWRSGMAQVGDEPKLVQVDVWIPHNMSKDCKSDSANDPRCDGCKWRKNNAEPVPLDGTGGIR